MECQFEQICHPCLFGDCFRPCCQPVKTRMWRRSQMRWKILTAYLDWTSGWQLSCFELRKQLVKNRTFDKLANQLDCAWYMYLKHWQLEFGTVKYAQWPSPKHMALVLHWTLLKTRACMWNFLLMVSPFFLWHLYYFIDRVYMKLI